MNEPTTPMENQRILIHVENGIVDTVLVEDEMQTGNTPNIEIVDIDDQASDPVHIPPANVKAVTTRDFEAYKIALFEQHGQPIESNQ